MEKFETFGIEELETVAIKVSWRPSSRRNWKHEEFNTLPSLKYEYKDTDIRFADKSEELRLYRNAYWETELVSGVTRQNQYERDIREAVLDAINKVNDEWKKTLAEELERDFK